MLMTRKWYIYIYTYRKCKSYNITWTFTTILICTWYKSCDSRSQPISHTRGPGGQNATFAASEETAVSSAIGLWFFHIFFLQGPASWIQITFFLVEIKRSSDKESDDSRWYIIGYIRWIATVEVWVVMEPKAGCLTSTSVLTQIPNNGYIARIMMIMVVIVIMMIIITNCFHDYFVFSDYNYYDELWTYICIDDIYLSSMILLIISYMSIMIIRIIMFRLWWLSQVNVYGGWKNSWTSW